MIFTCIECEFPYREGIDGDGEERLCYKCLDKQEEENEIPDCS